ncbi:helix-turn-helix transcriptional regulator [Aestuariibaculum sp. M13]|uniref:helix-turn-helix domain-containing protein n=1 Tax=Aestuariibaculum sp. M13 TaxID=2967132 RepID=UPI002159E60B|nr:helix-turn-helix transcriptional regulator [Aestuariibaculum sp. M13]MCR8668305.1 helix-turn-helix transcriptional regulator [Aestuariibaculum sp. M13]
MSLVSVINFLLIAGVLQGFGFNLVTFGVKRKFNPTVLYLNLIVLAISLNNLQAWLRYKDYLGSLITWGLIEEHSAIRFVLNNLEVPWHIFIVPMFYAFTVHYFRIEDKVYKYIKPTIILFVAEIVIRLGIIVFDFDPYMEEDSPLITKWFFIENIINLGYSLFMFLNACLIIFKKHYLLDYIVSYDDLNWIKWFVRLGVLNIGLWGLALLFHIATGERTAYLPLNFCTSVLLYWLGYQGFYKYTIVSDRISLRSKIANDDILTKSVSQNGNEEGDDFFNEKHQADFAKIKAHIVKRKLYLDPLLSMEAVASDLGMSKSYFSKLINSYSDYNFSDFINSLRVKQAKKFLSNDEFSEYTIVAIGLECGFNSKSTFYSAFKKFTSVTPTIYRSQF